MNSNNTEELPPPRPYTEYNMFFQIERGKNTAYKFATYKEYRW